MTSVVAELRRQAHDEAWQLRRTCPPPPATLARQIQELAVPVTCIRCGSPVQPLATDNPRGLAHRERRISLACTKRHCSWAGVVCVELVDLNARRAAS